MLNPRQRRGPEEPEPRGKKPREIPYAPSYAIPDKMSDPPKGPQTREEVLAYVDGKLKGEGEYAIDGHTLDAKSKRLIAVHPDFRGLYFKDGDPKVTEETKTTLRKLFEQVKSYIFEISLARLKGVQSKTETENALPEDSKLTQDTSISISQDGEGSEFNLAGWLGQVWQDDKIDLLDKGRIVKIKNEDYVLCKVEHKLGRKKDEGTRTYTGYIKADKFNKTHIKAPAGEPDKTTETPDKPQTHTTETLNLEQAFKLIKENPKLAYLAGDWKCSCSSHANEQWTHFSLQDFLNTGESRNRPVLKVKYNWDVDAGVEKLKRRQCANTVSNILNISPLRGHVSKNLIPDLIHGILQKPGGKTAGLIFDKTKLQKGDVVVFRGSLKSKTEDPEAYAHNRFSHVAMVRDRFTWENEDFLIMQHSTTEGIKMTIVPTSNESTKYVELGEIISGEKGEEALTKLKSTEPSIKSAYEHRKGHEHLVTVSNDSYYKNSSENEDGRLAFAVRTSILTEEYQPPVENPAARPASKPPEPTPENIPEDINQILTELKFKNIEHLNIDKVEDYFTKLLNETKKRGTSLETQKIIDTIFPKQIEMATAIIYADRYRNKLTGEIKTANELNPKSGAYYKKWDSIIKAVSATESHRFKHLKVWAAYLKIFGEETNTKATSFVFENPNAASTPNYAKLGSAHVHALDIFFRKGHVTKDGLREIGPHITAMQAGIVISASNDWKYEGEKVDPKSPELKSNYKRGGFSTPLSGNGVAILVGDEVHYYSHMDSVTVKQGQIVKSGQIIGRGGNSGTGSRNGRGNHLHLQIHKIGATSVTEIQSTEIHERLFK